MRLGKTPEVSYQSIAESLTVDVWFDKFEFSEATGINLDSCNNRLRPMKEAGHLESKPGNGRLILYRMSEESKQSIIKHGLEVLSKKPKKKTKAQKAKTKNCAELARKARDDKAVMCWEFLKKVNFI